MCRTYIYPVICAAVGNANQTGHISVFQVTWKYIYTSTWYGCVFCFRFCLQMRVLETELLRAAAHRDLLRKVALEAEARQNSAEDREEELERKSEVRDNGIALLYRVTVSRHHVILLL